jgi:deoxyribonuclease-1
VVIKKNAVILFFALLYQFFLHGDEISKRGNSTNDSFKIAKKNIMEIYKVRKVSFYCSCVFSMKKKIYPSSCGYVPKREGHRTKRIEIEHIVPASVFGRKFPQWKDGHIRCVKKKKGRRFKGRKCVVKTSKKFRYIYSDLYNLYPAIGELNRFRSNYPFTIIPNEERKFGKCDFEIKNKMVEPKEDIRGDIARTYFYMNWAYPKMVILSEKDIKLFTEWGKSDPVDSWECERAQHIQRIQGNVNIFVAKQCKKDKE